MMSVRDWPGKIRRICRQQSVLHQGRSIPLHKALRRGGASPTLKPMQAREGEGEGDLIIVRSSPHMHLGSSFGG